MNGVITEKVTHVRDYDYEIVCGAAGNSFPKEYEIPRDNTGTLRKQKYDNCVAEVIAQLAESFWGTQFDFEEHSEGFIYGAYRSESSTSPGLIVSKAMECWRSIGTIQKKHFDIDAEMPEIKKIVKKYPDLYEMAQKCKISGFVQLRSTGTSSKDLQIKDALTKYNRGLVAVSPDGFAGGSHCIMLTGWNDNKNKYKIKNSWGDTYGDDGFAEIDKDEISQVYMPIFEPFVLPFEDVKESDWFYKHVKNTYFSGMMNGTSENTFDPDKPLTRAEAAAMFDRLMKNIDERLDILGRIEEDKKEYLK